MNNIKKVILKGGLGNQIFQYAFSKYLASLGHNVVLDGCSNLSTGQANPYLDKIFMDSVIIQGKYNTNRGVDNSIYQKIKRKASNFIQRANIINEDSSLDLSKISGEKIFDGYWQNKKFFQEIELNIDLNPLKKINDTEIRKYTSGCVAIHMRLGDYTKSKNQDIHGVLPLNYYQRAIELIKTKILVKEIILFSDTPRLAMKRMNHILEKMKAVEIKISAIESKIYEDFEEMHLMSLYDNIIISNSTFSYWAAFLGKKQKLVVAPEQWYTDNKCQEELTPLLKQQNWLYT